jgi:hypothetical protein
MNEPIDMMSEEWMDEFERNWGLLRTDRNNPSGVLKDPSSSTDTDSQHRNSRTATSSDQTETQS